MRTSGIQMGPRGGKFFINSKGHKDYGEPPGKHDRSRTAVLTPAHLKASVPAHPKTGNQSYMGVNIKTIKSVHEFDGRTGLKAIIHRVDINGKHVKTYKYTNEHETKQAAKKFAKAVKLGAELPNLRKKIDADLHSHDVKTRASATIAKLIDTTTVRVGGGASAKDTGSVGATTLMMKHLTVGKDHIRLQFPGKSGVAWDRTITDRKLVHAMKGFTEGKGKHEKVFPVNAQDVNAYLKTSTRAHITAKDFRTFHASAIVHKELAKAPRPTSEAEAEKHVKAAVAVAANHLGHTPAICRGKYVNPQVIATYVAKSKETA